MLKRSRFAGLASCQKREGTMPLAAAAASCVSPTKMLLAPSLAVRARGITWRVTYRRATGSGTTETSSLSQALAEPSTVVSRTAPGSGNALDYDF